MITGGGQTQANPCCIRVPRAWRMPGCASSSLNIAVRSVGRDFTCPLVVPGMVEGPVPARAPWAYRFLFNGTEQSEDAAYSKLSTSV